MEVLREYGQLVNKTKNVLSYDISETPMLDKMSDEQLEYIANHSTMCENIKMVGNLSELVFQLNDYVPALINYIKIFLYMKRYDAVKEFISKLYVNHIGSVNYQSKLNDYNVEERLFDRFIEVVKIGDIEYNQYMPLVLESIFNEKSSLYVWHNICMEFMQNFMRENEDKIGDYIAENSEYELEYLTLILKFNTQKGISILFNSQCPDRIGIDNVELFLKTYITDTLAYFDKYLPNDKNKRFHFIKVLSSIKNNVEVMTRLENIYEREDDDEIKEFLAKHLGITEKLNFGSEKHFKVMSAKKVICVQERSLGIAFENMPLIFLSGEKANDIEKTYLIDIFKEEKNLLNLSSLKSLYDIFERISLNAFAEKLFDKLSKKDDINSAKWCVRMFSLLSEDMFERKVYEFLFALYKLGRNKEALYLTNCLIYSKKPNFVEMFKRLKVCKTFQEHFDEFVTAFASINNVNPEEVRDLSVLDNLSEAEIEDEKQRLYLNFISGRKYSKAIFKKLFLYTKIFNDFAQRLVFGEYKQDKLYSVFVVVGKELRYVYGNSLDDKEVYISIVHTLDLDERFEKVDLKLNNPLFEQFKDSVVDVNNFNRANMSVSNLNGTIVNLKNFLSKMYTYKFYPNKNNDDSEFNNIVGVNKILNILVEIDFEKFVNENSYNATIGNIRFYRLSECMKDKEKYILNKTQSLSISGVNERYFDYVITSIQKSIKN